jgi:hypothetical protein
MFLPLLCFAGMPYTATKTITAGGSSYNYSVRFPDVFLSTTSHRGTIMFDAIYSTNSSYGIWSSTGSTIVVYDAVFWAIPADNMQNAGQVSFMFNFQPAVISTNDYTKPQ